MALGIADLLLLIHLHLCDLLHSRPVSLQLHITGRMLVLG